MLASKKMNSLVALVAVGVAFSALPSDASAKTTFVIVNGNAPGVGFNDPTPTAPVGGNTGTTLGQQRLKAFQKAADVWGSALNSNVPVYIYATFTPLSCTSTSAVLGSAGPTSIWRDFPNAAFPLTWHHGALANKLTQVTLDPSTPEIVANFNSNLGTPGCLDASPWYYGLDNNHGSKIDLVTVLLHEFGHGLGFSSLVSRTSGAYLYGLPGTYDRFVRDNTINTAWTSMSNAQRLASIKNGRNVAWTGSAVTSAVPSVLLAGVPVARVNSPAVIAGIYPVGLASFGPVPNSPGVTAGVVAAVDIAEPATAGPPATAAGTTSDGCSEFSNAAAMAGKIALVNRGLCGFAIKVKNAQNAGAVAVLVADNAAGSPPAGMSGTDATITIPSVRITLAAGNAIRAQLGTGVNATLSLDMTLRAGADANGRALIYTPDPSISGSSVSHWDTVASRNLLMEPNISGDLKHSVVPPDDLTLAQMRDIGWFRFTTCEVEGFTGSKLTMCQSTCKAGLPITQYKQLATLYRTLFKEEVPCAR